MIESAPPHVVSPPAIVAPAYDVKAAVARLKELKEARRRNTLETARIFVEIRRAFPDVPKKFGGTKYSPDFIHAIEEAGYSRSSIGTYLWLAEHPERAETQGGGRSSKVKRATYKRVLAVIEAGATIDDLKQAIQEELRVLG